jgi:hypothetical protein
MKKHQRIHQQNQSHYTYQSEIEPSRVSLNRIRFTFFIGLVPVFHRFPDFPEYFFNFLYYLPFYSQTNPGKSMEHQFPREAAFLAPDDRDPICLQ